MADKVTRKLKAVKRKTKNINKKQAFIDKESERLRKKLGDEQYEQLRTGKVKLDMYDAKTVSMINKRATDIKRKKEAINRKLSKAGMLNYQGDK
tara:strand:- start:193 stop:474 length:282 start_codon:yes stop_codon:yes gene_type:complete